ncbi:MAG: ATP-dependent DNA helicase, partial [Solirubrobacteraceae bacterium]
TFTDREARAVALEASAGASIDQALGSLDSLDHASVLLSLADGRQTTTRHRATEQRTVTVAQRVAAQRPNPLPTALVSHQALVLDAELQAHGAQLSPEQHQALQLACSDRQLVMIEGQAGTGKSTTLTAIARAHQADARQIIVTSTAALAAQHLAAELGAAGVNAGAYSTAALQAAINTGTLTLDPDTTVIHDEAALASTREQHQLLHAVQASGARLILIGDPRQNQAVGAGGLWPDLEQTARANSAHVRLTQIVRAQDPSDRRDQTLFRQGQHERALHGYQDRDRVHLADTQQLAEDQALDGAHADRQAGRQTLVICQTSNEHLDALNARAQAIRHQHGELGEHALPLAGRPYGLRSGDQIQIRQALDHPDLGRVANGTTAHVLDINHDGQATLELADGRRAVLTSEQADAASVRLAYVSHPFPAQGHTTDTTHLIVAEHTTAEGSYVALTRARQQTHIHASHALLADVEPVHQPGPGGQPERDRSGQLELFTDQPDRDPIELLAQRTVHSQPEIASIRTPLAHEQTLARQQTRQQVPARDDIALTLGAGEREHEHGSERQQSPQLPGHEHSVNNTREPEGERDNTERELADRLERARRACDDAQRMLDTYPGADQHQHRLALQKLEQTAQDLANHEAWAKQLQAQLDQLGPIARRREPGRQLKAQLEQNDSAITSLDRQLIELDRDADIHQQIVGAWEIDHPDARERVRTAERELDALIEQQARRRVEHPGEHLTRALGHPPAPEHPQRGLWDRTALQIERYRARYQIDPNDPAPLGHEPDHGPEHRQQRQDLEHARTQITLAATRLRTPDYHHVRAIEPADLARPAPHRGIDRGGWGIGL